MTCIAGIAQDGNVWIGGDSAGVYGHTLVVRSDEKVFRCDDFIYGFTDSFRMGDLLRYSFRPPPRAQGEGPSNDREYLCTIWINELRDCLAKGGWRKTEHDVESGGNFLVGYRGTLYEICKDFQVGVPNAAYAACGSGEQVALGSLFTTEGVGSAASRIVTALHAAEQHNCMVRAPFTVVEL